MTRAAGQMRILIVDDQPAQVALLEKLLRREGYVHVHGITDPAEVPELCQRRTPDLLLLDLHMPGLDGLELLARLAPPVTRGMSIIVMTGTDAPSDHRRALELGAHRVLIKPLDPRELLRQVSGLLRATWPEVQPDPPGAAHSAASEQA